MMLLKAIQKNAIWIICILSFLTALFYNETNLNHLPESKIRANETVITADGPSYLNPAKNHLKNDVWREGSIGQQSYYFRPPGYGIFYYTLLKTVGESHSLSLLKIIQLLLFSFSVYWFYYILISIIKNKKVALISSCIYGLSPFVIGFLYYTLTEGITPSLLLLYVFLLFKGFQSHPKITKNIFYLGSSIVFSYIFIIRPVLGVFSLLIPVFIIKDYWKISIKLTLMKLVLFGIISFSLMALWQIRNYNIANKYVGLNPIYDTEQASLYRPSFKAYWEFVGCWGETGHISLSVIDPFWAAAINGDTSKVYIDNILDTYPNHVKKYFGENRLTTVLRKYQSAILIQQPYRAKGIAMPMEVPQIEEELIVEINQLTDEYKSEFWFQYHVISPLRVFKTMTFHSNLSLHIFQHTYRGAFFMELTRWVFFILHSLCFIALIISLALFKKTPITTYGITLSLFIYVFYLCYFQRGLEERYTLPALPLLMIGLVNVIILLPFDRIRMTRIKEKL
jgi:hypothetical protein